MQTHHFSQKRNKLIHQMLAVAVTSGALVILPQIAKADITVQEPTGEQHTAQNFTRITGEDGVNVTPQSTFSVDSSFAGALSIVGLGTVTYNAQYESNTISTTSGDALQVFGNGDIGSIKGSVSIISNAAITGGHYGIRTTNNGTAGVDIILNNDVTLATEGGVFAGNYNANSNGDITIKTQNSNVSGGRYGIQALSKGKGGIDITTNGNVTAQTKGGIYAEITNGNAIGDITINAQNGIVSGGTYGIYARNSGTGGVTIDSSVASVTGTDGRGIYARTSTSSTGDLFVTTNDVTGTGDYGVYARQDGTGKVTVIANGKVTSDTDQGIHAEGHGGEINITAHDIDAGDDGINVKQYGTGDIIVTTMGDIISQTDDGIDIVQQGNGDVTVNTFGLVASLGPDPFDPLGFSEGIVVDNEGTGATTVNVDGEVHGATDAIYISSGAPQVILNIGENGNVHNTSDNPADLAIWMESYPSSASTITNDGIITGGLRLGEESDALINNFFWDNTGGSSDFGNGDDVFTNNMIWDGTGSTTDFGAGNDTFNNNGTLWAATPGVVSATKVLNLETVNNNQGILALQNDLAGDTLDFTNGDSGVFNANGGVLTVDVDFANNQSDKLLLDNVVTGSAPVLVDVTAISESTQPTTGDGIKIVEVSGTSDGGAFALNGPLAVGLYNYNLGQGTDETQSWFLQSQVRHETAIANMLSVLGSRTALATLSNMHDRQRDAKVLLPDEAPHKGVWARTFGNSEEFNSKDSNDFGYKAHTWGAQAGIDFLAKNNGGGREYAGLYVAYADSNGDARQHGANVADLKLNATTVGAYYTKYAPQNWYFDLTGQYSWLSGVHARTAAGDINPNGSSYALSGEIGQQFGLNSAVAREVQAQLIYQNTDIHDVTLDDETHLSLAPLNAITGRVGMRLYGNPKTGKTFLPWARANVWHTFNKDASVSSLGHTVSTPIGGTSGELELGFSSNSAQSGWSFYGSAGYLFNLRGAAYKGWKGTLGLRKGW